MYSVASLWQHVLETRPTSATPAKKHPAAVTAETKPEIIGNNRHHRRKT
jgi:hypothetical protein